MSQIEATPVALGFTNPDLLRQLRSAGILREMKAGSGRRPAILSFPQLIKVAEGRDVL